MFCSCQCNTVRVVAGFAAIDAFVAVALLSLVLLLSLLLFFFVGVVVVVAATVVYMLFSLSFIVAVGIFF